MNPPSTRPEIWRSEAFAEDLCSDAEPAARRSRRGTLVAVLLGVVPVVLAAVGAVLATWGGAA